MLDFPIFMSEAKRYLQENMSNPNLFDLLLGWVINKETCSNWKLDSFSDSKWREIKEKLKSGKLVSDDFAGTSVESDDWIRESIEETDDICELLKGLINLPDTLDEFLYCVSTYDGYAFYATYDKFKEAVERDDCDYAWDDLSDDILELWIERLNNGELDGDLFP